MTSAPRARPSSPAPASDGRCTTANSPSQRHSRVSPDAAGHRGPRPDSPAMESRQLANVAHGDQPIVLLDASLSMTGAPWRAALDSARGFARRRAVVWRFGTGVTAFDTAPPAAGASHLGPALEAAAGRAGEVVVVTDGNVDDLASIPVDLLRRPRVIVQARAPV